MIIDTFINLNKKYLTKKMKEATDRTILFYGFGCTSAQQAFNGLLVKNEGHLLPFCLYLINFGLGVSKDESFAQSSLELISFNNDVIANPTAAYIYAYCLNRNHDVGIEKSEAILRQLYELDFPPAIITLADADVYQNSINSALKKYKLAMDKGHKIIWGRYYKLLRKQSVFPYNLLVQIKFIIRSLSAIINIAFSRSKGVDCLYLDFYDVGNKIKR